MPGQQQDPVTFEAAASETGLPEQPACPVREAEGGAYDDGQFAAQFLHTMHKTGDGDNFSKLGDAAVAVKWGNYTHPQKWPNAFKCNVFSKAVGYSMSNMSTG